MAKRSLCRYAPKVGAECLNWVRSDLCGGRSAMTVPTAIGQSGSFLVPRRRLTVPLNMRDVGIRQLRLVARRAAVSSTRHRIEGASV